MTRFFKRLASSVKIIALILPFAVYGQQETPIAKNITNGYVHLYGSTMLDSVFFLPVRDTIGWNNTTFRKLGRFTVRPQDRRLYFHDSTKWQKVALSSDILAETDPLYSSSVASSIVSSDLQKWNKVQYKVDSVTKSNDSLYYWIGNTKSLAGIVSGAAIFKVGNGLIEHLDTIGVDTSLISTKANVLSQLVNYYTKVQVNDSFFAIRAYIASVYSNYYTKAESDGRYLQSYTETDPTVPSYVKSITSGQPAQWDAAYNHISNTSNPHAVTKAQIGLGNVDNTSDVNKPISTATQSALNLKQDALGYSAENVANKATSFVTQNNTLYPSVLAVKNYVDAAIAAIDYSNYVTLSYLGVWSGSANITTVGTIGTGTWNATAISVAKGGTGLTSLGTSNQVVGVNAAGSALEYKSFATGTSGTSFNIAHTAGVITFNQPLASASATGVVSTSAQTFAGVKTFSSDLIIGTGTWGRGGGSRANNITIGVGAGAGAMTTGSTTPNIFIGAGAGAAVTGGYSHIFLGYRAGYQQIGGDDNIGIGYRALYTSGDTYYNIAIGTDAGYNITNSAAGLYNTVIGHNSGKNIGAGQRNTAYGFYSLGLSASSGGISYNTAYGQASLANLVSGNNNVAVGANALFTTTSSANQIALGYYAGYYNTGNNNTFIGFDGTGYTSVSNHIFIGDGENNLGLWFNSTKAATFSNTIKTAQPSANGAGAIKIGKVITGATVTLQTDKFLEVEIDGTIYKLAIVQ